jgi:hypothetical protein
MHFTWFPRNLLLAVALVGLFAWALPVAIDFRVCAVVGLFALLSYLAFETGLTFNPGVWGRKRKP